MIAFRGELYNIMPIINIPSVMEHGILSHNEKKKRSIQSLSVAMNVIQDKRDGVSIPGGMTLHNYANLYLDARNTMMYKLKSNNRQNELCVLIIDEAILQTPEVVIADRNASSSYVRFLEDISTLNFDKIYADDWTHPECAPAYYEHRSIKCAEVLVPYCVPFKYITCAHVANEQAKNLLKQQKFPLEIFTTPDMFFC